MEKRRQKARRSVTPLARWASVRLIQQNRVLPGIVPVRAVSAYWSGLWAAGRVPPLHLAGPALCRTVILP